ncbi:hypothetical protein OC844_001663, partial [Tilletia horrida]
MSSPSSSLPQRLPLSRAEKALRVQEAMREANITFSEFLDEFLANSDDVFTPVLANWAAYREGRTYGPLHLIQKVSELISRRGSRMAREAYFAGLVGVMESPVRREMEQAGHIRALKSNGLLENSEQFANNQFRAVAALQKEHLPLASAVARLLCGTQMDDEEKAAAEPEGSSPAADVVGLQQTSADDVARGGRSGWLVEALLVSVGLNFRNDKINRLQTTIGLLLRFQHAPDDTQTMLTRLCLSTGRNTSNRHLARLQKAAIVTAKQMMQAKERVHVLLFDNVDLYMRVRPGRITSVNQLVNLTSRVLVELPSSYSAESVSASAIAPLDSARSLSEDEITGDGHHFRRAANLLIAKALQAAVADSQKSATGGRRTDQTVAHIKSFLSDCQDAVRIDELDNERWGLAPLPLLEENEGSIEGVLSVLEDTAVTLGLLE